MSADKLKSNRISDDSGVVCFNSFDDPPQSTMEYSVASSPYASVPPQNGMSSAFQYSVQGHPPSSIIGQVKRREKKKNYVIGSGIMAPSEQEMVGSSAEQNGKPGKYGSKRISHVQQMRLRFENLCKLNNSPNNGPRDRKCEAVNCKGGVDRRTEKPFESLPIIPLHHDEDDSTFTSAAAAGDSFLEVSAVLSVEDRVSTILATTTTTTTSSDCECDDNDNDDDNDAKWKSEGDYNSLPVTGELCLRLMARY